MPHTDRMPTAARLVTALALAAVAWIGSDMFRPLMPPDTAFGWFNWVNAAVGLVCGWQVVGARLGRGWLEGGSAGLTGLGALIFWALFLHSLNEMLKRALENRYDGPLEGLVAIFELGYGYATVMLDGSLLGWLVGGAVATGLIGEWVARRWR